MVFRINVLCLFLALSAADSAWAQGVAPSAQAPEKIENPLSSGIEKRREVQVRQISPIEFGTFAVSETGGSITLDPSGVRRANIGVSLLNTGSYGPAEFEIMGQPGEPVAVFLPDQIPLDSGGGGLPVTQLTASPPGEITLDETGRARLRVGGTLRLSGTPRPGTYSGYFMVDVRYIR